MEFCFDHEEDGQIWVDRGQNERADRFRPCTPCFENLKETALEDRIWNELNLCTDCRWGLIGELLQNDFLGGPRPIIGDSEHTPQKAMDDIDWNLPEPLLKQYLTLVPEDLPPPPQTDYLND